MENESLFKKVDSSVNIKNAFLFTEAPNKISSLLELLNKRTSASNYAPSSAYPAWKALMIPANFLRTAK